MPAAGCQGLARAGTRVHDQERFNHNEKQKWKYSKNGSSEIMFREVMT